MRGELQEVLDTFGGAHTYRAIGFTDEIAFSLYGDSARLTSKAVIGINELLESSCYLTVGLTATAAFGVKITARAEQHVTLWRWERRQKLACEFGDPQLDAGYRCRTTDVSTARRVLADPMLRQWLAYICAKDVNVEYFAAAPGPGAGVGLFIEPVLSSSPRPVHLCQAVGSLIRALRSAGLVG